MSDRRAQLPSYVSVSQLATLRRCPKKFEWAYLDSLRKEREANALWFGQILHLGLADWYLPGLERGPHPAETFARLAKDEERFIPQDYEEDEAKYVDALSLGIGMLEGYVQKYGRDEHQHWIATEQEFSMLLPQFGRNQVTKQYPAMGRVFGIFDGVFRDLRTDEIWLAEHKGFKDTNTRHLPMDPQGSTYLLAAGRELRKRKLIGPKEEIVGVMYNILRKALPPKEDVEFDEEGFKLLKPKKADYVEALAEKGVEASEKSSLGALAALALAEGVRVRGPRAAGQPGPLFIREPTYRTRPERLATLQDLQAQVVYRDALASGQIPIFKNQTKDCSWDCDFYRMCQLHQAGEDWEDYRDQIFKTRAEIDAARIEREERKSA